MTIENRTATNEPSPLSLISGQFAFSIISAFRFVFYTFPSLARTNSIGSRAWLAAYFCFSFLVFLCFGLLAMVRSM
jgi:hypothetical protein